MEVKTKVTDLEVYGNIIEIGGYGGVVSARKCISGEEYADDFSCVRCKPAFYSYKPMTDPGKCKTCFEVTEN